MKNGQGSKIFYTIKLGLSISEENNDFHHHYHTEA